jgi:hypothetical protein
MQAEALAQELRFYEAHKADWLQHFPGLFVVIKGDEWRGPFPSAEAAYSEGLSRYGVVPMLVKQVLANEPVAHAPLLFSAQPPHACL